MSGFVHDVWSEFRPYAIKILTDFFIAASVWAALFVFHWITTLLPLEGWVTTFVLNTHAAGVTVAFGVFALLFIIDVYKIHRGGVTPTIQCLAF